MAIWHEMEIPNELLQDEDFCEKLNKITFLPPKPLPPQGNCGTFIVRDKDGNIKQTGVLK